MPILQSFLGRLPTLLEDLPLPSRWLAHPPGGAVLREYPVTARRAPPVSLPQKVRLLSWNIHYGYGPVMHHGRGQSRAQVIDTLEGIAAKICEWRPDIVALQEVDRGALRSHYIDQLEWLAETTGLAYSAWSPTWDAGWVPYPGRDPTIQIGQVHSGQVVLSRYPLSSARRHALPQPGSRHAVTNLFYLHRCLLEVQVHLSEADRLTVFNAHLEAFDARNRETHAQICAGLLARAKSPALLMGDMNSVPPEAQRRHAFADEPETDMRDDQTLSILRGIPGLQEAAGQEIPPSKEDAWHTFPAHAPNRRLDYIFLGSPLSVDRAWVERTEPPRSDHLPVLTELSLNSNSAQ